MRHGPFFLQRSAIVDGQGVRVGTTFMLQIGRFMFHFDFERDPEYGR